MTVQSKIEPQTLLGALAVALPQLEAAKKTSVNPHFKAKYADLGAILEAIQPIAEHGLWFRQVSHEAENGVSIETFYIHDTGELSAGKVFVPADKANAQGYGSAQTYARRYGLQMAFGLATEDDDGNAANARQRGGSGEGQNGGREASPTGTADQRQDDRINEEQLTKLQMLIKATNTAEPAFLRGMGAPDGARVFQLPQSMFAEAVELLEKKLAKMAKSESNSKAGDDFAGVTEADCPF